MKEEIRKRLLLSWFDRGMYLTASEDEYGDTRYVGLHGGRCSEVVTQKDKPDELTVFQYNGGGSYLGGDGFEFEGGIRPDSHEKNLRMIGMEDSGHDFRFELARNYSECHTTITMIK